MVPLWRGRLLALLGILLVALSLRTAVASISPIIAEISASIPLDATRLGVIGMLPPLCFAVFGMLTPAIVRVLGLEISTVVMVLVITTGLVLRAAAGGYVLLLFGSVLAFAGMGAGNVLLPPLVKRYFPDRIGFVTSLYVTVVSVSTFVPPLVATPVADSAGWRVSLGMWAVLAVAAAVPWIRLLQRNGRRLDAEGVAARRMGAALRTPVWRSRTARAITLTFAVASFNAFSMFAWLPQLLQETAGMSATGAGAALSLYAAVGVPLALAVPVIATRIENVSAVIVIGVAGFVVGYLGLLLVPATLPWLWVTVAGIGPIMFPLALVLVTLRTRSHEVAGVLSGFAQGVGFLIAAMGPLLFGLLRQLSGSWTLSIVMMIAVSGVALRAAYALTRPVMVEDDVTREPDSQYR